MTTVNEAAETAYATIVNELAAPYFFEKLSAYGVVPSSDSERAEIWAAASKLHVLYAAEQEKAAAAQASKLAATNSQLDEMLAAAGLTGSVEKSAAFGEAAKVAADQPEIAQAVLTLQAAAAAALHNAQ